MPSKLPGALKSLSDFRCTSGFSCLIMKDIQRIIGCLLVNKLEACSEPVSAADRQYLAEVATGDFTPKVVMPMSAQVEWRRVGFADSGSEIG